jgi:hypothetical protein
MLLLLLGSTMDTICALDSALPSAGGWSFKAYMLACHNPKSCQESN